MTIERAIEKLKLLKSYQETYGDDASEDCQALGMAIEALEKTLPERKTAAAGHRLISAMIGGIPDSDI